MGLRELMGTAGQSDGHSRPSDGHSRSSDGTVGQVIGAVGQATHEVTAGALNPECATHIQCIKAMPSLKKSSHCCQRQLLHWWQQTSKSR